MSQPDAVSVALDLVRLGREYEQQLGVEARKNAGAYYTPRPLVDYVIEQTVGALLPRLAPAPSAPPASAADAEDFSAPVTVLDPACGGGWFLIAAYQTLLDWQLCKNLATKSSACNGLIEQDRCGQWRLTFAERERVLFGQIHGVDIDPQAVDLTKQALLQMLFEDRLAPRQPLGEEAWEEISANVRCGNAIVGTDFQANSLSKTNVDTESNSVNPFDWQAAFPAILSRGGFDAVIGNPPYLDSQRMTAQFPATRDYCNGRYQAASGNWDMFCVFCEQALRLCRPGGLASFIVPNKLCSANYAAATRKILAQANRLVALRDYSACGLFAAAVYPIVYVVESGRRSNPEDTIRLECMATGEAGRPEVRASRDAPYTAFIKNPPRPWPMFLDADAAKLLERVRSYPPLAAQAQVLGAATVAEAYEIRRLVRDDVTNDPLAMKLVNSGTIDRYRSLWGVKTCRYLGERFLQPTVGGNDQSKLPAKRAEQARAPKILVAGMTKRLECIADPQGRILAGKSTTIILQIPNLHLLLGILNSRLLSFYFAHVFGGNKLQGGYLRIGPPQIRALPIPNLVDLNDDSDKQELVRAIVRKVFDLETLNLQRSALAMIGAADDVQRQIDAVDREIDALVYRLYGLAEAEIQLMENAEVG